MDHFGIGKAMYSMVKIYCQTARRSGRTTSLVESIKNGDRVVFQNRAEAERVKRLCADRKIKIESIVVDPKEPVRLLERGRSEGRTLFDHSWVEQYYLHAIEKAGLEIDHFQIHSSGDVSDNVDRDVRWEEIR